MASRDHMSIGILHSGSKAQEKGNSGNPSFVALFPWSSGPQIQGDTSQNHIRCSRAQVLLAQAATSEYSWAARLAAPCAGSWTPTNSSLSCRCHWT